MLLPLTSPLHPLAGFLLLVLFFCAPSHIGLGQNVPVAFTAPHIKSVRLHPEGAPLGGPFLELGGQAKLVLKYDDLTGDWPDHEWTMVHCNSDWTEFSDLTDWDFIEGWAPDPIGNIDNSFGGVVPFAHARATIPSANLAPSISGNYLLIVHEAGEPDNVVILRRFVVYEKASEVNIAFRRPLLAPQVATHQRLEVSVELPSGHRWTNPMRDVQISILQNGSWPWAAHRIEAGQWRGDVLIFDQDPGLTFSGGDRWRSADLKSLSYLAPGIERIVERREEGGAVRIELAQDASRRFKMLGARPDLKGSFTVHNDRFDDVELTSEYLDVRFSMEHQNFGAVPEVYLFGAMTGWALDPAFKMSFDAERNAFFLETQLKQGWYDYRYIATLPSEPDFTLEGEHNGTSNRYQIMVHAPASDGTDRIIGFEALDSN